jgi:hypothetical protein
MKDWFRAKSEFVAHLAGIQVSKGHKKSVNPVLPAPEALGKPTQNDKSKAHAVWREHFADLFNSVFAIKEIS